MQTSLVVLRGSFLFGRPFLSRYSERNYQLGVCFVWHSPLFACYSLRLDNPSKLHCDFLFALRKFLCGWRIQVEPFSRPYCHSHVVFSRFWQATVTYCLLRSPAYKHLLGREFSEKEYSSDRKSSSLQCQNREAKLTGYDNAADSMVPLVCEPLMNFRRAKRKSQYSSID